MRNLLAWIVLPLLRYQCAGVNQPRLYLDPYCCFLHHEHCSLRVLGITCMVDFALLDFALPVVLHFHPLKLALATTIRAIGPEHLDQAFSLPFHRPYQ